MLYSALLVLMVGWARGSEEESHDHDDDDCNFAMFFGTAFATDECNGFSEDDDDTSFMFECTDDGLTYAVYSDTTDCKGDPVLTYTAAELGNLTYECDGEDCAITFTVYDNPNPTEECEEDIGYSKLAVAGGVCMWGTAFDCHDGHLDYIIYEDYLCEEEAFEYHIEEGCNDINGSYEEFKDISCPAPCLTSVMALLSALFAYLAY